MNVIICTTWTSPIRPKHSACFGHLGRLDIWIKPWFKWYISANCIKMVLVNSAPEPVIYFKESPNQVRETRFSLKSVNMMQPRTDKRPEAINVQVWNISSSFSSLNLVLLLCLVFLPKICYPLLGFEPGLSLMLLSLKRSHRLLRYLWVWRMEIFKRIETLFLHLLRKLYTFWRVLTNDPPTPIS